MDKEFKEVIDRLDQIDERIHEIKCTLYEAKLNCLYGEQLAHEAHDKCAFIEGEYDGMLERKGEEGIREYLLDKYCAQ